MRVRFCSAALVRSVTARLSRKQSRSGQPPRLCLDEDRERAVVNQRDLHHRAELAGLDVQAPAAQVGDDRVDEGLVGARR